MKNKDFYKKQTEQSLVKATIVAKYFNSWSKIIIPHAKKKGTKIAYVDLFCGRGIYEDGSESTPLLILKQAIANPELREMLVTIFNDKDGENTQLLQLAINSLPNIDNLQNQPIVLNKEVGTDIFKEVEWINNYPTLYFIDPWGYKGLSMELISASIKKWGCDCIFFFNYNRINMVLNNQLVEEHMNLLFGKKRADSLREKLLTTSSIDKELTIIEAIYQSLQDIKVGDIYAHPFCFKNDKTNRTSHYLIFITKNQTAYSIMKQIMGKESSTTEQGVPSFDYNPATKYLPLLFELASPLDDLENMLLTEFAGQTLTVKSIYDQHNVGKRYILKNYKAILMKLELQGKIRANPAKRRANTMGDNVEIIFPPKQEG